jgi:predicted secreted protein
MSMGSIPSGTYNIVSGAFSDDGAFFAVNLAHSSPMLLTIYYWSDIAATPVVAYTAPAWLGYRMGDSCDAVGSVSDNSVKFMVSGNTALSQPLVLTTADNGANWTATSLTNAVRAQDIHLQADGSFWAVYAGGALQKYDATGVAAAASVTPVALRQTSSVAPVESETIILATGYAPNSFITAYLESDDTVDAELDNTSADEIDTGNFVPGVANGSTATEVIDNGDGTYTVIALAERDGVASWDYDPSADVQDWTMY